MQLNTTDTRITNPRSASQAVEPLMTVALSYRTTSRALIGTYLKNTIETDFYTDKQKQDAVIRRIEIIGETTRHT
jgi:hypothetical protein